MKGGCAAKRIAVHPSLFSLARAAPAATGSIPLHLRSVPDFGPQQSGIGLCLLNNHKSGAAWMAAPLLYGKGTEKNRQCSGNMLQ